MPIDDYVSNTELRSQTAKMAQKLVLALLCAAVAVASARDMLAAKPTLSVSQLPKKLQDLNAR